LDAQLITGDEHPAVLLDQQIQEPGLEADDRPGEEQGHRQNDFRGTQNNEQMKLVQTPLVQSLPAMQLCPSAHFMQVGPPQSTSVSVPFLTPSKQVAARQMLLMQTLLWQAFPEQQGCPALPHCVHVPPKQTKVVVPQALPEQQGCPAPPHATHVPAEQTELVPQAVPLGT